MKQANGNVGIGTTFLTTSALTVMNGNVGIGTWVARTALDVEGTFSIVSLAGNVGIGSLTPGSTLDVNGAIRSTASGNSYFTGNLGVGTTNPGTVLDVTGAVRMTGMTLTGNGAANGYVLTASDSAGDSMWSSAGGVSGWTVSGNNVYETGNGNVGIGTTFLTTAALTVMNGNVGIGTWAPGLMLDVKGTLRTSNLTMSNGNPSNGYLLTASDSAGDTTWSSAGLISGWTVSGNNVYETGKGNVGIGTTFLTTAALTVMNGNVGIGTWVPGLMLDVTGTIRTGDFTLSGNNATNGYILTTSDSAGLTWSSAGLISGWTVSGNNVYELLAAMWVLEQPSLPTRH